MESEDLLQSSNGNGEVEIIDLTHSPIPEIDITQPPVYETTSQSKPIDIPYLSPPPPLPIWINESPSWAHTEQEAEEEHRADTLDPVPWYWDPSSPEGMIHLTEAELLNDPEFDLLWLGQQENVDSALPVDAQATRQRSPCTE